MKDVDIANAASKLIDAKYHPGPGGDGYDCLSMLVHFYGNLGIALPSPLNGDTMDNYAEVWRNGGGTDNFREWLMSLGEEVTPHYELAGDLLIYDNGKDIDSGIFLGSGHVLIATKKGCVVIPCKFAKNLLISRRRLL